MSLPGSTVFQWGDGKLSSNAGGTGSNSRSGALTLVSSLSFSMVWNKLLAVASGHSPTKRTDDASLYSEIAQAPFHLRLHSTAYGTFSRASRRAASTSSGFLTGRATVRPLPMPVSGVLAQPCLYSHVVRSAGSPISKHKVGAYLFASGMEPWGSSMPVVC